MVSILHLINPVKVDPSSDLHIAQPITFESLRRAKDYARDSVEVNLLTAQYPEDHDIIPIYFTKTRDLTRSILDVGEFTVKRKLPLIKDILDRAVENSKDGDYIIYSNVDIAVQPHFYEFIATQIGLGLDAFVINRRTISSVYNKKEQLSLMYTEIGVAHPGYDCFVLKKNIYPKFELGETIVGANWVGRVLILNLIANTKHFICFEDINLTFHLGDDKVWKKGKNQEFSDWNTDQLFSLIDYIKDLPSIVNNKLGTDLINSFLKYIKKSKENVKENIKENIANGTKANLFKQKVFWKIRNFFQK